MRGTKYYPTTTDRTLAPGNRGGLLIQVDKQGTIRYVRIGEGGYHETERLIQGLLAE